VNQYHRGRIYVASLLVMNANALDIDEARMLGMKNDIATLVPVGIAWSKQKIAGDGERCSTCDPVSLLHRNLAADERGLTLFCVHPRKSAAKTILPRQQCSDVSQ